MLINYKVGHVVFDRYMEKSLKNKTRQKRSKTETSFLVHKETKLTMILKELLSSSDTKKNLTAMLAEELLKIYSNQDDLTLYVIYDNKIKGKHNVEEHNHEEADTLIVHQVLTSVSQGGLYHIDVWSPDTDVLILLLDLVANKHIQRPNQLNFITGKGVTYKKIDVVEHVQVIGASKYQGLIGLHNFSGADWGKICWHSREEMD